MAVTHRQFVTGSGENVSSITTGSINYGLVNDEGKIVLFFISSTNADLTGQPVIDIPTLDGVSMNLLRADGINSANQRSAIFYLKTADIPSLGSHSVQVVKTSGENVHYNCFTLVAGNLSEINILDSAVDSSVSSSSTSVTLDPTGKVDSTLFVYDNISEFDNITTINPDSGQSSLEINNGSTLMRTGFLTASDDFSFSQGYSISGGLTRAIIGQAVLLDSLGVESHNFSASIDSTWTQSGAIIPQKFFQSSIDAGWTESGDISGGLKELAASISAGWTENGSIEGQIKSVAASIDAGWTESSLDLDKDILLAAAIDAGWTEQGAITFDFSFKWSIEHLEASTSHGFPSVYVQVDNTSQPVDDFTTLVDNNEVFERRLLEMPRLQEVQLDDRSGLAGFQRVTLQADNSDGLLNGLDLQDSYVKMFFVDADGNDYKEFNGKVVDWTLSHTVTINVEDLDALAFTQELPKRTLNDLVEAEKETLTGQALDDFTDSVVADDLGKPIPIIFGRAVKVPLLYVKADETLVMDESKREYDYIIGEGLSVNPNNDNKFKEVFTVYREDQALDNWSFSTPSMGTTTTVPLSVGDGDDPDLRRPDGWYKYWWIFGGGHVRFVTEYDSQTNTVTLDSPLPLAVSNNFPIELREWRFYPGDQGSPYDGYAFIRFKKRLGTVGRTDQLYADVNGLQEETNRAAAIASIVGTVSWGLGLTVDAGPLGSFAAAAASLGPLSCEGAIINKTSVTDILQKLLSYRDMVLFKGDNIEISVDGIKNTVANNFGLGDQTGYNNILNGSPSITFIHPNQKVKDLKVRYRKNHKDNDTYFQERTRSSGTNGVDETIDLPFVYNHLVADKFLDYKRKRLAASDRTLSLDIGEDGKKAKRGNRVAVDIPSLGVSSDWEVTSSNVTPAGSNTINLVPYNATTYTYDQDPTLPDDETGIQEPFDIPPDFTNTPPEPVTGLTVDFKLDTIGVTPIPNAEITWTPPDDGNYGGALVSFRLNGSGDIGWRDAGIFDTAAQIQEGFIPGQLYDFRVVALNITKELKSIAVSPDQIKLGLLAGGDGSDPDPPTDMMGESKFGDLVWDWTNSISTDVLYHEVEVYDAASGGNLLDSKKYFQGAKSQHIYKAQTNDLTIMPKPTAYATVRAVDYTGNASDFINPRVEASTDDIRQEDILENEITNVSDGSASGPTSAFGNNLVSASISVRGYAVKISAQAMVTNNNLNVSTGNDYSIKRGSTTLQTISRAHQGLNNDIVTQISFSFIDESPGSGSKTYHLYAGTVDTQETTNMYIRLTDLRR